MVAYFTARTFVFSPTLKGYRRVCATGALRFTCWWRVEEPGIPKSSGDETAGGFSLRFMASRRQDKASLTPWFAFDLELDELLLRSTLQHLMCSKALKSVSSTVSSNHAIMSVLAVVTPQLTGYQSRRRCRPAFCCRCMKSSGTNAGA